MQSGVALIMVLWVLVIMTVMAASFSLSMRREGDLVRNIKGEVEAAALADAGVYNAMLMLMLPIHSEMRWRADGSINEFNLADAIIRVQIYDEVGKIDLNVANQDLLLGALVNSGLTEAEAAQLIDAILDWRDEDNLVRPNGAEEEQYKDSGYAYGPRNKPFQTLEELLLVKGITPELYRRLEHLLTVHSKQPGINARRASREVLLAVPGADAKMVDEFLAARKDAEERKEPLPEFPVLPGSGAAGGQDVAYRILSEAMPPGGLSAQVEAFLLRGQGKGGLPFSIVTWKRVKTGTRSLFRNTAE
ncbi:MAG: hypothetical protein ABFS02_07865 [Pseudomonadota bacterium]